jgi:hypothetical protein
LPYRSNGTPLAWWILTLLKFPCSGKGGYHAAHHPTALSAFSSSLCIVSCKGWHSLSQCWVDLAHAVFVVHLPDWKV